MNWIYGVSLMQDGDDVVVSVRDLPEVVTSGATPAEALELAADAIEVAVAGRIEDNMELVPPSAVAESEIAVPLAPHLAAKASVYRLWKAANISKAELARRMGRTETEARRILDPSTGTKLEQLDEAARALGARLVVGYA
jgi:antitoxin HicB